MSASDEHPNVTLHQVHTRLVKVGQCVGSIDETLLRITANQNTIREALQQQQIKIAQIHTTCGQRGQHCDDRFARLEGEVKETTGVTRINELELRAKQRVARAKREAIRWAIPALISFGGLVLAVLSMYLRSK